MRIWSYTKAPIVTFLITSTILLVLCFVAKTEAAYIGERIIFAIYFFGGGFGVIANEKEANDRYLEMKHFEGKWNEYIKKHLEEI